MSTCHAMQLCNMYLWIIKTYRENTSFNATNWSFLKRFIFLIASSLYFAMNCEIFMVKYFWPLHARKVMSTCNIIMLILVCLSSKSKLSYIWKKALHSVTFWVTERYTVCLQYRYLTNYKSILATGDLKFYI